jgi:hypothetical protein
LENVLTHSVRILANNSVSKFMLFLPVSVVTRPESRSTAKVVRLSDGRRKLCVG